MASTDARPVPQKNVAYRVTLVILDADGDLVTGATGLDSEISKDGGTFTDCTNEATEIATSSGMYYLDLTSTEMNADTVAIIVKTTSSGAKTTPIVMYPEEAGDIRTNVTYWNGTAVPSEHTAGYPIVTIKDGTGTGEINTNAGGIAVVDSVTAIATGGITAGSIAADAIGASELAADAVAEIADAVWDEDATGHQTQGTFGQAIGDPVADTNTIYKAVVTDATGATVGVDAAAILDDTGTSGVVLANDAITAAKIAADAIDASALAADAVTEIWAGSTSPSAATIADAVWDEDATAHQTQGTFGQAIGDPVADSDTIWGLVNTNLNATISSRASQTSLDTLDDYVDTEVASILAAVDTEIGAIKTVTDQITFGTANRVNAQVYGVENNAITAASIATNAIDADAIAADAVTEIQSGLATAASITSIDGKIDTIDNFLDTEIASLLAANIVASGTIGATGNSTTALHLDGLTYGDDEINDYLLVIRDISENEYHTRWIDDWTATGDLATVATLPFTPQASTDTYTILPVRRDALTAANVWAAASRTLTALDEDNTTLDLDATIRTAMGLAAANLDTQLDALPTAAENTTAVWAAGTRSLTVLDEDSTTLDLDATIRSAVGLASANLDTQLDALPTAVENADQVLSRNVSNVEGTMGEHTLGTIILAVLEHSISGTTWTIKRTNGTTTHATKTLTVEANADSVTGVA